MAKIKVCGECGEPLVLAECSIGCSWECHNPDCYYYFYNYPARPPVQEREASKEGEKNEHYCAWDGWG